MSVQWRSKGNHVTRVVQVAQRAAWIALVSVSAMAAASCANECKDLETYCERCPAERPAITLADGSAGEGLSAKDRCDDAIFVDEAKGCRDALVNLQNEGACPCAGLADLCAKCPGSGEGEACEAVSKANDAAACTAAYGTYVGTCGDCFELAIICGSCGDETTRAECNLAAEAFDTAACRDALPGYIEACSTTDVPTDDDDDASAE